MTLAEYLTKHGLSVDAFRELIGVQARATVNNYRNGRCIPNREHMQRIKEVTKGKVMPNDFYPDQPKEVIDIFS